MMPGGETMALQSNSFGLGGGFGGFGNMMPGVMLPPRFMPSMSPMQQLHSDNIFTSELSLAPSCDIEERLLDGGQVEENEHLFVKPKEDESDSKSSSDNLEGGSGDDNEAGDPRPAKKKRYHRHTLHQIQEMERFFKECPHPDEKQRQELSRELKLSPRQIKFWFQNKRTKLKVHHERQDNGVLRAENEKLKVENYALRDAVRNVSCPSCGGPATLAEMSYDEQQLRIENMRLREEIPLALWWKRCLYFEHDSAAATRCKLPTVRSTQATEESASLPTTYAQQRIFKAPSNHGMPAVKKKTTLTAMLTARSEAACGGFEVEMEEAEEPLPDIDAHDVGNQLAVVDYVEDIYAFYRKTEIQSCVPAEYMTRQCDINEKMRAILIDWLIEVHLKFKLMPETLFLTINLIYRFLACHIVVRKNLQLIGVTAVLLASKYEEIWSPEVDDFVFISDKAYTREQVLDMVSKCPSHFPIFTASIDMLCLFRHVFWNCGQEKQMLNKLRFNLTVPTLYVFLVRFLKAATSDTDTQLEMLAFFLTELCLTEYGMMKYCPSVLAAAAVYTAQHILKRSPCWSTTLQRHSGYTEMHLRECAIKMMGFHLTASIGELKIVHKKYANAKFHSVALLEPAVLPM